MKGNIIMKSANRSNGKKVNLNLKNLTPNKDARGGAKFSRLSRNITQWYLLAATFLWFPWPFGDGLNMNHNEMFLADLS
jgi:hypothetical protein